MGHTFLKSFRKGIRRVANTQSTATLKAKKLLRRLEKEKKSGTEKSEEK